MEIFPAAIDRAGNRPRFSNGIAAVVCPTEVPRALIARKRATQGSRRTFEAKNDVAEWNKINTFMFTSAYAGNSAKEIIVWKISTV